MFVTLRAMNSLLGLDRCKPVVFFFFFNRKRNCVFRSFFAQPCHAQSLLDREYYNTEGFLKRYAKTHSRREGYSRIKISLRTPALYGVFKNKIKNASFCHCGILNKSQRCQILYRPQIQYLDCIQDSTKAALFHCTFSFSFCCLCHGMFM